MESKKRQSGIELLRLLAAISVVFLHYNNVGGTFTNVVAGSLNYYLLHFIESLCIAAVDIFILISGFFMAKNNARNLNKAFELIFQVILINIAYYIFVCVVGKRDFNIKRLCLLFLPCNYFVILYSVLYFISPYINKLIEKFTKKEWKFFIVISLIIFSLYPTLIDILQELAHREFLGLSPITAWGNQRGFNIINFMLLYCIGAYLRFLTEVEGFKPSRGKIIGVWLGSVAFLTIWGLVNTHFGITGPRSTWYYHNPFVIMIAVTSFLFFYGLNFSSGFINFLAKASFICFLSHEYLLRCFKIPQFVNKSLPVFLAHYVGCCLVAYIFAVILYVIYKYTFGLLYKKLPVCALKYFEE